MNFLRLRSTVNTASKRESNVIDILDGSPDRFIEALDYPAEVLDAFETYLKGEGVDVKELDIARKMDKADKQSRKFSPLSVHSDEIYASDA